MAFKDVHQLLKELNISYNDFSLYEAAFTHVSYRNENQVTCCSDYDRLEFIGDAVLGLVVGDLIYHRFPKMDSGQLSKCRSSLVMGPTETGFAVKMGFADYIRLSKGETKSGPVKSKILEDVFEAFIGAFYLDNQGDFEKTKRFVNGFFAEAVNDVKELESFDYKSQLQEIVQANGTVKIEYKTVSESGEPNDKMFNVEVSCNDVVLGKGTGKSKKKAEQEAAKDALSKQVSAPKAEVK